MKNKTKVNTDKLNEWISPSREILQTKVLNKGKTIMTEEEFNKIMFDE
jgi:hypothetical protein